MKNPGANVLNGFLIFLAYETKKFFVVVWYLSFGKNLAYDNTAMEKVVGETTTPSTTVFVFFANKI